MAKKRMSPEARRMLKEIRAEVRAIIELLQGKLEAQS